MRRNPLKICLLSRQFRSGRVLRITPVDGLEHVAKLCRRDRDYPVDHRWPDETAALQTLGIERHADPVMPEDLQQITLAATENVQVAGMGITSKTMLRGGLTKLDIGMSVYSA